MHKRPEFVSLHKARADISHTGIKKVRDFFTHSQKQRKNRPLMCASDSRDGANTTSLTKRVMI